MMKLNLLKIGGKVWSSEKEKKELLQQFAKLEGPKILVHGGGKKASELCQQLDIPVKMLNGRRITDGQTLEVATMVYGGLINKQLVANLQALGIQALGMSGADLNLIRAQKRLKGAVDYGYVGDITAINLKALKVLLEQGFTPVICALSHDGKGQLLNTNADTIASTLAKALSDEYEVQLHLCLELSGVLMNIKKPESLIATMDVKTFKQQCRKGLITEGMIPKLKNGFEALESGVQSVQICGPGNWYQQKGTQLCI
ncbi:MAG: acetylglutamate kinase [Bacteroidota bacterium]